ncbi:carbohydrate ABC transporter permease [Paenibacillus sp. J2TS4]|uniref:carbohydrate ABC transporter permease n=1 Tax=Paenibacillus sp. J2TS4 TaxID=2807194 RepID=UPI001B0962AE|nr:carbohydrate ABC transporter permease [Paenibacillus sp. J2TS4]GIP31647.1 putative ABC transporter permease protein YtcP [Paenibacillus sp. J2TS4]
MYADSTGRKIFEYVNYLFLILVSLLCLLPFVHVLAVSLSSTSAATSGLVKLWPVDFTLQSYMYILKKKEFLQALWVSVERVLLGTSLGMLLTILLAYPLSKETRVFKQRTWYVWYFVFTILFGGGLVPWFLTIKYTGLIDSIWALVVPGAVNVFNVVLLLNFFRGLPKELEESVFIDGAGHWTSLWKIYVPLSLPALATIMLFTVVGHWNAWFDGIILMNSTEKYPLSSYLQTMIINKNLANVRDEDIASLIEVSNRTAKAAQIFIGALPMLILYPFLQKYFMKGIVLGSVKE